MHSKAPTGELMAESAKSTLSPELEQLRRDMIAAIDDTLALVSVQWTIRELRLAVGADGRVESSPLLRRRPRRHGQQDAHRINIVIDPDRRIREGGSAYTGGAMRNEFHATSSDESRSGSG